MATAKKTQKGKATSGDVAGPSATATPLGKPDIVSLLMARRTGKKGRPAFSNLTGMEAARAFSFQVAFEVWAKVANLGDRRGDFGGVVRAVAKRRQLPEATVKKYAQRHKHQRQPRWMLQLWKDIEELERRMLGFPDDVRDRLMTYSTIDRMLTVFRDKDIDGTCPRWLIDEVRATDLTSLSGPQTG